MTIIDRLLAAKPAAAERPGIALLMRQHLDDIEVAGGACGCEHRSFTKANAA